MDELLSIISKALTLKKGLGFDRAMILLVNEEEDALYGAAVKTVLAENASHSLPLTDLLKPDVMGADQDRAEPVCPDIHIPLKSGQNVLADTALEKKGFIFSHQDGQSDPKFFLPLGLGKYSFATVAMLAKGKVVGVIAVDRDLSRAEITNEDLQNLSMLANQAGLAIENSRLYEYIEQMNLALSQTRERLLEAEKLAALGEMAAGMAHEIRNPLVSIGGFTRRLLKSMDQDSPHRVYIEVIINEVTRLEKTLSEVLDFSRDTLGHLEEHNLNDVLNEALYILRRDLKEEKIKILKDFRDIPSVLIDERQIKHVFFNLFFNAQQAMEKGGLLMVKTYAATIADRVYTVCEVSDEGPGIAPEVLPNIFNPFFTTKDTGTGLGLSIVHKIISRHNGVIEVVNRPEKGATFTIKLPAAAVAGGYLK
jgi:signal transduction histidine kinase